MEPANSTRRMYNAMRITRSRAQMEANKSTGIDLDFDGESRSGSEEYQSSVDTEIGGTVRASSSWFPEAGTSTEPVRRASRGRPPKRLQNAGHTPARQRRLRKNLSGSRERLTLGESSTASRRMSGGVKRKSDSMSAEYEIEDILDKHVDCDGITWYLILWKNYEKQESTWEPRAKLEHGIEAIQDFENRAHQSVALQEVGRREENVATGDNAGAPSRIQRFGNVLWQCSVNFAQAVITTSVALIGTMVVLAYFYALHLSHE